VIRVSIALLVLAASLAFGQELSFVPFHENGIYEIGEKAGWTVTRPQGGAAEPGRYTYVFKKNNSEVIQTGSLDFSSGSATIETKLNEPAMLYAEVRTGEAPIHLGAAIAPTRLESAVARPADFDAFWDTKLNALSEIPIHPELASIQSAKPGVELYAVKLDSLGSHVQGYLAKPAREGKFPALVIFQYAGVYALQPATVTDRAAAGWLAFDVDSHDLPPNQATGVSTDYRSIGNASRETSYFLKMYLRDARAIDYIRGRPDWDGKTIVFMGTSMGGQQSLVTAGLRSGITAVIVNEPSGADSNGDLHGRKAGYPNWDSTNTEVMKTALYFDTLNFASRIKAPVLAGIGFIDTIAPPTGIWAALNQIPGPKEVIGMVESDHNNITPDKQGAYLSRAEEVLKTILSGGTFEPGEEPRR
jgi:cephalosporin-C deacetylase-like acetyl esterase